MKHDELLPCPFCGSKAIRTKTEDETHWEVCGGCGATGPLGSKRGDEDDPSWNTRHYPPGMVQLPVGKEIIMTIEGGIIVKTRTLTSRSKRGADWIEFAALVLQHIDEYTVPQYGDEGDDIASDYSPQDALRNAAKYIQRYGKNIREGEQTRDFLKIAHYAQIAYKQWRRE